MTTTFSSALLRDRDKILEEKHKKELDAAERRLERLKRALDDSDKQVFDLRNRSLQLAESLGFSDINEAQRAFDVADYEVTFHQAFERVQVLEDEVKRMRTQREFLQGRCQELEELLSSEQKRSATLEKGEQRLQQELSDLRMQYDALRDKGKRAQDRFVQDRRIFHRLYQWLCTEPIDKDKQSVRADNIDFAKLQNQNTQRRRSILREFGSELSRLLGIDSATMDRMMQAAQAAPTGNCQPAAPADGIASDGSSALPSDTLAATTHDASDRHPLSPLSVNRTVKLEPTRTPKQTKFTKPHSNPNSSDTEDDSQAPSQFFNLPLPLVSLNVHAPNSSDTEDDSQAPRFLPSSPDAPPVTSPFSAIKLTSNRIMRTDLLSRPSFDPLRNRDDIGPSGLRFHIKSEPEDDPGTLEDEPPTKKPRLSLGSAVQTPKPSKMDLLAPRRVFTTGRMTKETIASTDENTPLGKLTTVTRIPGQTRMEDYTIYKGRGRYGEGVEPSTKTINAMFTINPDCNDGFSHQYEEVVRDKRERMRMDAGDCDHCREWYTAVGPMPPRDRGPLWRSPSTTPVKRCQHHDAEHSRDRQVSPSPSDQNQEDIDLHKKQVSRHRHNWIRPRTPPGYWNIGFPDTQEARRINEQAEEMHQRKFRQVEKEAERGKWTRR